MPLITFTSDYGQSDYYVGFVKAKILSQNPSSQIVDISHEVKPFDLSHMRHVVISAFKNFPEGTIHLIGGEPTGAKNQLLIALIEGHYFVAPDNGILSLISERTLDQAYAVTVENNAIMEGLGSLAAKLASGETLEALGERTTEMVQYMPRKARATRKEISGHVVHIDHYGNLLTNIEAVDFNILSKDRNYRILFGRETFNRVMKRISDAEPGDVFFVFDNTDKLMFGINQGNGAQLLGMEYDSMVTIQFEE